MESENVASHHPETESFLPEHEHKNNPAQINVIIIKGFFRITVFIVHQKPKLRLFFLKVVVNQADSTQ